MSHFDYFYLDQLKVVYNNYGTIYDSKNEGKKWSGG